MDGVTVNIFLKYMKHWGHIFQAGIEEDPCIKEEKMRVDGGAKSKGQCFQQSTFSWKETFKAYTLRLKYKVLNFGKQNHTTEFVKNCEDVLKLITVK